MSKTRGFYLIEETSNEILGAKLPSKEQVLSVFLHHHITKNKSVSESADIVSGEVEAYWQKARLPLQRKDKIKEKVKKLFNQWKFLKKNKGRGGKQKANEKEFKIAMKNLFDVAHANAMSLISIKEDKDFLKAQREPSRRGSMGAKDTKLAATEARSQQREQELKRRRQKHLAEAEASTSQVIIEESSSSTEVDESSESSSESHNRQRQKEETPQRKRFRPMNVWTTDLTAALDRTGTTDRNALFIVAETAKSLGHDPSKINISRSSVKRYREKQRQEMWTDLHNAFKAEGKTCIVHWDGKLLPSLLCSTTSVDRLPVLITDVSTGEKQLLGVPKLSSGTGENQAKAVYELLQEWCLEEKVAGFCFDTTASNTGRRNGACILLEQRLGHTVLNLACRHHINEILLAAVFSTCSGDSSGPDIQLFRRFQKKWSSLDQSNYRTGKDLKVMQPDRERILKFSESKLAQGNHRDDYKEFLELAIVCLGGNLPGFNFKKPGAFHHARWMGKVLYCLKIWMFRDQLKHLTKREESCVRDVSIFSILIYVEAWFSAPDAAAAPRTDLEMLRKLQSYHNNRVGRAAREKLHNHLWYVSEELVALSLFDEAVSVPTKRAIVSAMIPEESDKSDGSADEDPPKRVTLQGPMIPPLESFASRKSVRLLEYLEINSDFLDEDPDIWKDNTSFKESLKKVKNLPVINDVAKRWVKLIEDFNARHTTKEDQLQFLLTVVSQHRKMFPTTSKSLLASGPH